MTDATPTRRRWYQFTIKSILWATFWMAILSAAWTMPDAGESLSQFQLFLADAPRTVPLFIAIGALFKRARLGAVVGVGLLAAFYVITYLLGLDP